MSAHLYENDCGPKGAWEEKLREPEFSRHPTLDHKCLNCCPMAFNFWKKKTRAWLGRVQVVPYAWGDDTDSLPQSPDVITGADVVYEQEHYPALVSTLHMLAAPHTVIYLAFRLRGTANQPAPSIPKRLARGPFLVKSAHLSCDAWCHLYEITSTKKIAACKGDMCLSEQQFMACACLC